MVELTSGQGRNYEYLTDTDTNPNTNLSTNLSAGTSKKTGNEIGVELLSGHRRVVLGVELIEVDSHRLWDKYLAMAIELHFYPNSKILVAFERIHDTMDQIAECEAWGGPASEGHDPRMAEIPTSPGDYVIWQAHPYRTPTWTFSRVKWGTRLRHIHPGKPASEDIWFEGRDGTWISLKRAQGISPTEVKRRYHDLYGKYEVPKIWVFNDFGPYAIRYFVDRNHNLRLDRNERLMGEMIHTTPENESQHHLGQTVTLRESHGCIHIKPNDRDRMFSLGVFKRGTPFRVHSYRESFR